MAQVTEISTANLRSASKKAEKLMKGKENAEIRQKIASDIELKQHGPFGNLVSKLTSLKVPSRSASTASTSGIFDVVPVREYREFSSGIKQLILKSYDKATLDSPHHLAELSRSRDLDLSLNELTGGLCYLTNPWIAAPATMASITARCYLQGQPQHHHPPPIEILPDRAVQVSLEGATVAGVGVPERSVVL